MIIWLTLCIEAMAAPPQAAVEVEVQAPDSIAPVSTPSVTVIAIDEQVPASSDLSDVVSRTAGTTVRRLGGLGAWTTVSIRGSSARQVDVFIDGIPLNPDGLLTVNLAELPLRTFERVEIYRGFTPVWLGSSAVGGAINLVSAERPKGQAEVSAGSLSTARVAGSAALDLGQGQGWLAVEGLGTRGDFTFFNDAGTPFNTTDDRRTVRGNNDRRQGSVHASYRSGPWRFLTAASAREEGIAGVQYRPNQGVRWSTARDLSVLSWQRRRGAWSHRASVWGLIRQEHLRDPLEEIGLVPTGEVSRMTGGGAIFTTAAALRPGLVYNQAVHVGVAGWRRDVTGDLPEQRRASVSTTAGLTLRDRAEKLQLTPVIKVGRMNDAASDVPIDTVAPRLSTLWAVGEHWALSGNLGAFVRPPDLLELYGNQGVFVGNPDLSPERGRQADLGLRARTDLADGSVVVFVNDIRDQIIWRQNAQGLARPSNLSHTRTTGTELSLSWRPDPLRLTLSGTRNLAVQIDDGVVGLPIPGVPAWELHTNVRWQTGALSLSHRLDHNFGAYLDSQGFFRNPPRSLHTAAMGIVDGDLSLQIELLNALNRTTELSPRDPLVDDGVQVDRAVVDFFGYPLPGRTLLLTLRYQP